MAVHDRRDHSSHWSRVTQSSLELPLRIQGSRLAAVAVCRSSQVYFRWLPSNLHETTPWYGPFQSRTSTHIEVLRPCHDLTAFIDIRV